MALEINDPVIYRSTTSSRILLAILGLLFVAIAAFLYFLSGNRHQAIFIFAPLITLAIGVAILWQALVGKVILSRDHIELVSILGRHALAFSQIKGRRRRAVKGNTYTLLYAVDEKKKPLSLSPNYQFDATFQQWVDSIPDLDAEDEKEIQEFVAKDPRYGFSAEEKKAKLASLQRISQIASFAFLPIVIWIVIYPYPTWIVAAVPILMPWLAIALVIFSGGLYSVLEFDKKALKMKGNLSTFILMPGFLLYLLGSSHAQGVPEFPIEWHRLFLPAFAAGIVITAIVVMFSQGVRPKLSTLLIVFVALTVYSGCALGILNSMLDRESFKTSELTIINKHNTTGKHATYWLETVANAGDAYDGPLSLQVAPNFYRSVNINQHVCVHMHSGALGMRWENVTSCNS